MSTVHDQEGAVCYAQDEGLVRVRWCLGYVEVKIEHPDYQATVRFDLDKAKRLFADVHEQLGDP